MPESEPIIRLREIGKSYSLYESPGQRVLDQVGFFHYLPRFMRPQIRQHHALVGVSIEIAAGERVGVVGRNGAGKTTLLKLIAGGIAPTRGQIAIRGEVHSLLQTGLGFDPEFTGAENIRASLNYNRLPTASLEQAYDDIVDFCELGDHLNQPFKTYSAGMSSRLQFAASTAIRPDILIIDEVLGAGDSYFLQKSAKRMEALAQSGCTLLLVSHAAQQILHFCSRCIWIEEGRVVMDGPALDVCNAYDVFLERRTLAYKLDLPVSQFDLFSESEPIQHGALQAGESAAIDAHGAMLTRLGDGREVFRWPANRGLKIDRLALRNGHESKEEFAPGEMLVIEMDLIAEESNHYDCRYLVTFWSSRGVRIGRIENDVDTFSIDAGDTRTVRFTILALPLTRGEYLLSFSIYDVGLERSTRHGSDVRFDVLAHALRFRVAHLDDHSFLIQHPSNWSIVSPTPHAPRSNEAISLL